MELIYILRCKITNNFSYMQIYSAFFYKKTQSLRSRHNGVFMVFFESFDGVLEH